MSVASSPRSKPSWPRFPGESDLADAETWL